MKIRKFNENKSDDELINGSGLFFFLSDEPKNKNYTMV